MARALALTLASLAVAAGAMTVAAPAVLERGGPVEVGLVHVESGPHFLSATAAGEFAGTLLVQIVGPPIVARLARAIELDVHVEGVSIGTFDAVRDSPFLASRATFRMPIHADLAPKGGAASAVAAALDRHPGSASLAIAGTVLLPLGVERAVSASRLAGVTLQPEGVDGSQGPFAFSPPLVTR